MSEPENNTTPATPTQPVFPPIDATKAVPPVTPFPAWTWNTPVIPQFYWNVYSSEQRIRQICVEIGRIQAYLEYFAANSNAAHWYLDNRFTQVETRLTARVDKLEKELGEEVARLDKALADETKNRVDGDKALQAQIDATKTALEAETSAREAGDKANAAAISKETADRKAGDDQLADDLATETNARANADTALGGRIDAEATARQDADTHLGERIAAEHTERAHDVQTLTTGMNRRPLATAITAKEGSGVTVESKETDDGSGTGVVIGSTWQGDFTAMRNDLTAETAARTNADGALEAKLDAETGERRHDDAELGKRIDGKLAFGAVRAGDGITVVNDPDTTTATVSAEVTKAKLDEAIAGIPAYKLPTATAERLGGVKVGTGLTVTPDGTLNTTGTGPGSGLETVSHDDTMDGDGTAESPLKVRPATATTLGGVKAGTGLTVAEDGTLNATGTGPGSGLETVSHDDTMDGDGTAESPLKVRPATIDKPGVVRPVQGLTVWDDGSLYITHGEGMTFNSNNQLVLKLGEGLAFDSDGAITATGAAGDSESVKRLEITKKQLTDNMGRGFQQSDFTTVNGGYFDGTTAMKLNLQGMLATVFNSSTYRIASIVVVDFNTDNNGSMVIDGHSIITYFTATNSESLANTLNSIGDNAIVYDLYCVTAGGDN